MNEKLNYYIILSARVFIALMFLESFIDKIIHWDFYIAEITQKNIPLPILALAGAVVIEILGSVALITGMWLRYAAFALSAYILIVSFIYFDFWNHADSASVMMRKEFFKNFAVIGGLMLLSMLNKAETKSQNKVN